MLPANRKIKPCTNVGGMRMPKNILAQLGTIKRMPDAQKEERTKEEVAKNEANLKYTRRAT